MLTADEARKIHDYLTHYFANSDDPISPPGVKDLGLLDSAINRPFMNVHNQDLYMGVYNKAAALFHSLIGNHCFYNGNKRTALLTTMVYLADNGWWLSRPTDHELFEFTRKIAAHEICEKREDEVKTIADWLKANSRKRVAGEHQLTYRDLKEILEGFGFELLNPESNTIEIYKNGKFKAKILQKGLNGKENYDKQYIRNLRKKLKLTPEWGVDSYTFYGERELDSKLSSFMKIRESVMRELAKI